MKWLYLSLHVFTVSFPLIRAFEPRIFYAGKWKWLWPGLLITAAFFLIWDALFTRAGVWGFNAQYHLGVLLWGMPVEEWLFFVTVPFASVFIYECVIYFLPKVNATGFLRVFSMILGVGLLILAVLFNSQAYTFWDFLFAGSACLLLGYTAPAWLTHFWLAYAIHLLPFFLVNGVLTGSFIDGEVVWYNNAENLGIRLGTIPIEDTMYSLLLLLMNVAFYEYFRKNAFRRTNITTLP